jgi:phosphatidylglycerophosphatase C
MNNLALFDFDGTITTTDSLSNFLKYISGSKKYFYYKYINHFHSYILYYFKINGYEQLKKSLIKTIISGMSVNQLNSYAKYFYKNVIKKKIKPEAIKCLLDHKKNGDKVVVVSASLDIILKYFCDEYECDLISNQLIIDNYVFTGDLFDKDCNGIEKVRRVKKKYKLKSFNKIYAYGDSEMDLPMLNIADYQYLNKF